MSNRIQAIFKASIGHNIYPLIAAFFILLFGTESALAIPITLAENVHVNGQSAGNNPYSFGNTFGAENFSLGGSYNISGISHVGHHTRGSAQPTSIDWRILADNASTPGAILFSGNNASFATAIEGTSGSYDLTRYIIDLSLANISLGAGSYWVSFHNNGGQSGDPHWTFASSGTSFDGISARSNDGGTNWTMPYPGTNMTFRVEGSVAQSVPEPATIALMGLGLAGLGFSRKRKSA